MRVRSPGPGSTMAAKPTRTRIQPRPSSAIRLAVLFTTIPILGSTDPTAGVLHATRRCAGQHSNHSFLLVGARLVVGPGAWRPGQFLGRPYDYQLVATRQQRDWRVEVPVDL